MLAKSFRGRMRDALKDPLATADQSAFVISILREQLERLEKQCGRSYLLFLGFAAAFSLWMNGAVEKFSLLGVGFTNQRSTALLLGVLAGFFVYRAVASAVFAYVLHQANGAYWDLKLGPFARNHVTELFEYPGPYATEAILANLAGGMLKKWATLWLFTMTGILCIAPLAWFAGASVQVWSLNVHIAIRTLTLITLWLFAARAIMLIGHFFVLLYQETKDTMKEMNPAALAQLELIEKAVREARSRQRAGPQT